MTDDHVIDIRQYLAQKAGASFPRVFSVWGGEGGHSRFALPVWRAVNLLGGDWGGIVSLPSIEAGAEPCPLFVVDLKEEPARTMSPLSPLPGLRARKAPSVAVGAESGLAVLLGEGDGRQWFLRILGGRSGILPEGKARETLLFLAGECSGLLFHRELATPLPSSSSAP